MIVLFYQFTAQAYFIIYMLPRQQYEELVTNNRYGIRKLETNYFQNQYEKMMYNKNAQKQSQLIQKSKEHEMIKQLNKTYLDDVLNSRKRKVKEMESLSQEYNQFIKSHENKNKLDKLIQKNIQKSTLTTPSWVRDVFTERQVYKKNIQSYSRALDDHVKLQQMRKQSERQEQYMRKNKINKEAQQILKKQYEEMEYRHRQKSLFERRQNELLGISSQANQEIGSSGLLPKQTVAKRRLQDLYSQGLSVQYQKQQQKRYNQQKMAHNNSNIYNPVTNPIPFIYKNPNLLRMMAHN